MNSKQSDLTEFNIGQLHQGLIKKEFSSLEITQAFLDRIKKTDGEINAFLTVAEESAILQAKAADRLISEKAEIPLLAGVPLAVKDNILVEGIKCTAGSKILENYLAPYDATAIRKIKEQGAVILGKTNLDEFGMGSSTENSAFKITHNPHDPSRVPGGSSGGSAAAVANQESCCALGSDTGGSIRQPASFCGLAGLKPTYGAVSRYGLIAYASSLDQIGPIAKTVEDCKIVFETIRGKDEMDSTSQNPKFEARNSKQIQNPNFKVKNLRIGVPKEYFGEGIDKEVEDAIKSAISKIEKQGAKVEEISLPYTKYALACYYIIATSETSANLARYDGIKYGHSEIRNPLPNWTPRRVESGIRNLLDVYLESRGKGFGEEVRRRIMLGTYSLSAGYYDAYYKKAQEVRNLIKNDFQQAFEKVDLIFAPVSPFPAFKIGERVADPLAMYLADVDTISANLAGLPALSLPCAKAQNLPVGLQIIGNHFEENKIFETAQLLEKIV